MLFPGSLGRKLVATTLLDTLSFCPQGRGWPRKHGSQYFTEDKAATHGGHEACPRSCNSQTGEKGHSWPAFNHILVSPLKMDASSARLWSAPWGLGCSLAPAEGARGGTVVMSSECEGTFWLGLWGRGCGKTLAFAESPRASCGSCCPFYFLSTVSLEAMCPSWCRNKWKLPVTLGFYLEERPYELPEPNRAMA